MSEQTNKRTITAQLALLLVLGAFALSFATPAEACLKDSRTQYIERNHSVSNDLDFEMVLAGGFARESDEYYRRIAAKAEAKIEESPLEWSAYDDLGVALDKLGDPRAAIEVMQAKFEALETLPNFETDSRLNHVKYDYLANAATFAVHAWAKDNIAEGSNLAELRAARDLLEKTIAFASKANIWVNSRETAQLAVVEGLLRLPLRSKREMVYVTGRDKMMLDLLGIVQNNLDVPQGLDRIQVLSGLIGMVELGNAWESVDVLYTIGVLAKLQGYSLSANLAFARAHELAVEGNPAMAFREPQYERELADVIQMSARSLRGYEFNSDELQPLIAAADSWSASRRLKMKVALRDPSFVDLSPMEMEKRIGSNAFRMNPDLAQLRIDEIYESIGFEMNRSTSSQSIVHDQPFSHGHVDVQTFYHRKDGPSDGMIFFLMAILPNLALGLMAFVICARGRKATAQRKQLAALVEQNRMKRRYSPSKDAAPAQQKWEESEEWQAPRAEPRSSTLPDAAIRDERKRPGEQSPDGGVL